MVHEADDPTTREWMTIEEIATYLGQSIDSARSWCSKHGVKRTTLARTEDVVRAKMAIRPVGRPRKW